MNDNQDSEQEIGLDITIIVDRSGSMDSIREDAIGAFNTFLSDKKRTDPDALMSVVLFDHETEVLQNGVPIIDVTPLTHETYIPRGNTALLDAIGKTIGAIQGRPHENEAVLVAILTDGQENASTEWGFEQIRNRITELENRGWDFVYLSSDFQAFTDGERMGIKRGKIYQNLTSDINKAYANLDEEISKKKFIAQQMRNSKKNADRMYQ